MKGKGITGAIVTGLILAAVCAGSAGAAPLPPMHVGSIQVDYIRLGDGGYSIRAAVAVEDREHMPVPGAAVAVQWTLPPGAGGPGQWAVTDRQGEARFKVRGVEFGRYEVCVTGVRKEGMVYEASLNEETCAGVWVGPDLAAGPGGARVVYAGACPEAALEPQGMAPNGMFVAAIVMGVRPLGGLHTVWAVVRIVGEGEMAVSDAVVSVQWGLPDGSVRDRQGGTDAAGRAGFRLRSAQRGRYQVCVKDVSKEGWQYAPELNRETFESLMVP